MKFTANDGYKVPETMPEITGATGTYTRTSDDECTIVLSNPTGDVSFRIAGVLKSLTISITDESTGLTVINLLADDGSSVQILRSQLPKTIPMNKVFTGMGIFFETRDSGNYTLNATLDDSTIVNNQTAYADTSEIYVYNAEGTMHKIDKDGNLLIDLIYNE